MQEKKEMKLSESEYRLMEIVWKKGAMEAATLTAICLERFDWKKPTVYTMLKRLGAKGALVFENRIVEALVPKELVDRTETQALLDRSFGGSLPNFMAAFLQDRKLTPEEAERLNRMIEEATKG